MIFDGVDSADYDSWKTAYPEHEDYEGHRAFKCSNCYNWICVGDKYYSCECDKFGYLCSDCCEVNNDSEVCEICGEEDEKMYLIAEELLVCTQCVIEWECEESDIDFDLFDDED